MTLNHFIGMHDEPISLDEWAERYEDIESRTLHREPISDTEELALIWCGELIPELAVLPWGLVIRQHPNGSFRRELAQFPNRAAAEAGWSKTLAEYRSA